MTEFSGNLSTKASKKISESSTKSYPPPPPSSIPFTSVANNAASSSKSAEKRFARTSKNANPAGTIAQDAEAEPLVNDKQENIHSIRRRKRREERRLRFTAVTQYVDVEGNSEYKWRRHASDDRPSVSADSSSAGLALHRRAELLDRGKVERKTTAKKALELAENGSLEPENGTGYPGKFRRRIEAKLDIKETEIVQESESVNVSTPKFGIIKQMVTTKARLTRFPKTAVLSRFV